jgi:F0F1-type ATP synthase gamma subunit
MGREGVQYILIIMGRGVIKFQNFQKIKIFKKFQNFQKISKFFKKFQNFKKLKKKIYKN